MGSLVDHWLGYRKNTFWTGHDVMAIYLDNNSTTQPCLDVCEAVSHCLQRDFGNPSSAYGPGRRAAGALEQARDQVGALVGAEAGEVIFTSGGTESNCTAIAAALSLRPNRRRIVVSAVEHASILEPVAAWAEQGWSVVSVGVDCAGRLKAGELEAALDEETALVCLMAANNETGVLFDVAAWSKRVHAVGAMLHVDATQAAGKIPVRVEGWGVDFAAVSAHKLHGPKGVGALYVAEGMKVTPILRGGGQEKGWRSGTSNVPGIVGFGVAAKNARARLAEMGRVEVLRNRLEAGLRERIGGVSVQGAGTQRLPNTANMRFMGVESEILLTLLDMEGIYASTGSACSAGAVEPSHVLAAMGLDRRAGRQVIRFSLSRCTQPEEVETVIDRVATLVARLRADARAGGSPAGVAGLKG